MSVLLARRGTSAVRPSAAPPSGTAGITGTVSATGSGTSLNFASLPASSLSYLALIFAADSAATTPIAPSGWTLLTSGNNANDAAWSRWWAFVGSASAVAGNFQPSGGQVAAGVIIGFDSATTISMGGTPATPNVTGSATLAIDSPSFTLAANALVIRSLVFNSTNNTPAITYPTAATLGRATNVLSNGAERGTVAVAAETKVAGAAGTASWSVTGQGIYQPVAHSFQVLKA